MCQHSVIPNRLTLLWLAYLFNFDWTTVLRWLEWNWTDASSRAGKASLPRDNPSRRQGARGWADRVAVEAVSACYLTVLLAIQSAWLGYGPKERCERCSVSRKRRSFVRYNAVEIGIFTRLSGVRNFPTVWSSSLHLSQSAPSFHTSSQRTFNTSWPCL